MWRKIFCEEGQRGTVGELVHRVSAVELTIQWMSLYIKSH